MLVQTLMLIAYPCFDIDSHQIPGFNDNLDISSSASCKGKWFGVLVEFQKKVVALSDPLIQDHNQVIKDVKWMLQLHAR